MPSLHLVEIIPASTANPDIDQILATIASSAELIEAQVTSDHSQIFAVVETDDPGALTRALADIDGDVSDPAPVLLVGAELADIKAVRPEAGYLVEWDIPEHIDLDTYLERKAAKAPLYANVPEVSFLRTYVREDTAKCLCFYDAPDEEAVRHARDVVSTPVDRLHTLRGWLV